MPVRDVLEEPEQKSEFAYFMEEGITSMVSTLRDGTTVEVGLIGKEGMVGIPAVMCTESIPFQSFVQVGGYGHRIKASRVREEFQRSARLREKVYCWLQSHLVQMGQIAVCNRIHGIEERLSRWLLSCYDRVGSDNLPLTQEFLSTMLGAPRSTVTLAAQTLQQTGVIEYSRGKIHLLDRKRLEHSACECYAIISKEAHRLNLL
jgi:CRP-like cAMP-binding protein